MENSHLRPCSVVRTEPAEFVFSDRISELVGGSEHCWSVSTTQGALWQDSKVDVKGSARLWVCKQLEPSTLSGKLRRTDFSQHCTNGLGWGILGNNTYEVTLPWSRLLFCSPHFPVPLPCRLWLPRLGWTVLLQTTLPCLK